MPAVPVTDAPRRDGLPAEPAADVLVVGAGAAGAAVAWRLATAGLDVVCLERGGWVDQRGAPSARPDWERALATEFHPDPAVRRAPADYPVIADDTPIRPALFNAVGGSTIRWGAHFPRFHPSDFRVGTLDGVGRDWPIGYRDLEPYYDLNDRMMGVAGLAGDPANPPRAPRPMPPLPLCPGTRRLAEAFDRLGWHWWPSDAAIASIGRDDGRGACNHCGPCGLTCPRHARASADLTYWPAALEAGARLVTGAAVARIETGGDGDVVGATFRDAAGAWRFQPAGRVVVAGNGMGTARLLLASATEGAPAGLANATGLVGRNLMHHPTAIVTGIFAEDLGPPAGAFACAFYSQEFYETDRARGAVRGYQLQALRGQGPAATALGGYMARLPWGAGHHASWEAGFGRSVSLTVTAEDLPDPDNRITLDPVRRDRAGVPAARLAYRLSENSRRLLDHGIERAREAMVEAGAVEVRVNPLAAQAGFHFLGTARMGDDPAEAVVDGFGRAHDVPGLWLVDGAVFPSAAAVNPTPTLQAVALRAADRLAGRVLPRAEPPMREVGHAA